MRFGTFEVDIAAGELRKRGVRIRIQEQPFQILLLLLEHPGEVISRELLRRKLWAEHTFVDFDRSLNTAITRLRAALGDSSENPRFVETVPRHGYRFIAPVSTQDSDSASTTSPPVPATVAGGSPAEEHHGQQTTTRKKRIPPWVWITGLTAAAGILGVIFYLHSHSTQIQSAPSIGARRSVAVLGFKNLTGDVGHAWLSTALSDWLSAELAAGDQLRTIPEENVARMKIELALPNADSLGKDTLRRVRQNLGSDLVVIGSYATLEDRTGGQIRVDIHLQDTATGETLATISQLGTEAQLFQLISHTGERLRATVGVHPATPQESAAVAVVLPSNPDAARLYSEGLARLRVYDTLAAVDLFQKAIASESDFALSYSALSTALSKLGSRAVKPQSRFRISAANRFNSWSWPTLSCGSEVDQIERYWSPATRGIATPARSACRPCGVTTS